MTPKGSVRVRRMTWTELNARLVETEDEAVLRRWLKDAVQGGRFNRAMRIHGRLSAVRRAREHREICEGTGHGALSTKRKDEEAT